MSKFISQNVKVLPGIHIENMKILCLWHKTVDEMDAFGLKFGLRRFHRFF